MSAHITFPAVDSTPGLPSTLSHPVLTGLLRNELGFDGLIVTDALEMQGVADQFTFGEAAVMAVQAGVDIVLIAQSRYNTDGVEAVKYLVQAVRDGTIAMERIDESLRRIVAAKRRVIQTNAPFTAGSVAGQQSVDTVRNAARHAVTVVRDHDGLLPLNPDAVGEMLVVVPRIGGFVLAEELGKRVPRVKEAVVSLQPTAGEIEAVLEVAADADTIVVATTAAAIRPEQAALVRALHALERKLLVLAVGEPYDLVRFPDVPTYVAAYGSEPLHVWAAVEVLFGEQPARGRLPVSIPELYRVGHGIRH